MAPPRPTTALAVALAAGLAAAFALHPRARSQPAASTDDETAPPPPAADLAALERAYKAEPDANRRLRIVQQMAGLPGAADALARVVRSDPSDDVALAAAYILRRMVDGERRRPARRPPGDAASATPRARADAARDRTPPGVRRRPEPAPLHPRGAAAVHGQGRGPPQRPRARVRRLRRRQRPPEADGRGDGAASTPRRRSTSPSRWATTSIPPG